jgi:prepilin-type N-terminal cleavage/methylation domain-containing protein
MKLGTRLPGGFSLPELLVASAVSSMMLAAFLISAVSIRRSLEAIDDYGEAQADQVRLSDYVALDLRRASTVNTTASTSTVGGVTVTNLLTLTMPGYYNYPTATGTASSSTGLWAAHVPYLNKRAVVYGATNSIVTVTYYKKGAEIYRREDYAGRTSHTLVASDVEDFEPEFDPDTSGDVVNTSITFAPQFQFGRGAGIASRQATAIYNRTFLRGKKE